MGGKFKKVQEPWNKGQKMKPETYEKVKLCNLQSVKNSVEDFCKECPHKDKPMHDEPCYTCSYDNKLQHYC